MGKRWQTVDVRCQMSGQEMGEMRGIGKREEGRDSVDLVDRVDGREKRERTK